MLNLKNKNFEIINGVLIKYTGGYNSINIPEGVISIGSNAFSDTKLIIPNHNSITITIPNTVTRFEEKAFIGSNLRAKFICDWSNIQYIGDYAFSDCILFDFGDITLHDLDFIGFKAFFNCNGITSLNLSNIHTIGYQSFAQCKNLKSIILGPNVKELDEYCFYDCNTINFIEFYGDIIEIYNSSFENTKIKNILYNFTNSFSIPLVTNFLSATSNPFNISVQKIDLLYKDILKPIYSDILYVLLTGDTSISYQELKLVYTIKDFPDFFNLNFKSLFKAIINIIYKLDTNLDKSLNYINFKEVLLEILNYIYPENILDAITILNQYQYYEEQLLLMNKDYNIESFQL